MSDAWTHEEVEAAVADYFAMLAKELRGEAYNKAEHNRHLQLLLQGRRPKGSIERKHQNISAILIELGFPYIDGYKPLGNYQQRLRVVVEERLGGAAALKVAAAGAVEAPADVSASGADALLIQVAAPSRGPVENRLREDAPANRPPVVRNYLEMESRNRSLGLAGEERVLHFEHQRLWQSGHRKLAEKVEHVARTEGDHLGYDILSFEEDGRERLIEVKTTRFGLMTPFFVSRHELGVSVERQEDYHLYRLFHFDKQPKLFVLEGSISSTCELEPVSFSVLPK